MSEEPKFTFRMRPAFWFDRDTGWGSDDPELAAYLNSQSDEDDEDDEDDDAD